MRRILFALIATLAPIAATAQDRPEIPDRFIAITPDTDFPGGDLTPLFDTTFGACRTACLTDSECRAFTFNERSDACFPKSAVLGQEAYEGALSARVSETDPAVLAGLAERREALSFLRDADFTAARSQAEGLALAHYFGTVSAADLTDAARAADLRGDRTAASQLTAAAITLTDDPALWSAYGRRLLAQSTEQNQPRSRLEREALQAATNAALRAPDGPVLADALDILAGTLEEQGRGRDSIPALRLALVQGPRADLEEALDRAIGLYGFRVTDTQVDSEAADPRICAVFSEDLAADSFSPTTRTSPRRSTPPCSPAFRADR